MPARLPFVFRLVLGAELSRWGKAGQAPLLWWRDDDARAPTEALERLLDLSRRRAAPLTLAAIAGPNLPSLVRRAAAERDIEIAVHGFKHVNRQPEGIGFGEIVESDTVEAVANQLQATALMFQRAGAAPTLFVPPWNNMAPQLIAAIASSPLRAVSGFEQPMTLEGGVCRIDAHLDVLRWKGGARFRGRWKFLSRMRRLLAERRLTARWTEPIGVLTHHLDHDRETWRFLEELFAIFPIVSRQSLTGERSQERPALSA